MYFFFFCELQMYFGIPYRAEEVYNRILDLIDFKYFLWVQEIV